MNAAKVTIYEYGLSPLQGTFYLHIVKPSRKAGVFLNLSKIFAVFGTAIILGFYSSNITNTISSGYKYFLGASSFEVQGSGDLPSALISEENYLPKLDRTLPEVNMVKIPSVGIETEINEAVGYNYEEALRKGVWRASDFGDPDSQGLPTILVAHRFGYLNWGIPYRLTNSFYNLPKTKDGDLVEVIWMQRKYTYAIYAESEGEFVTDYSADLILYTCKSMNSSEKIFRYARLLKI